MAKTSPSRTPAPSRTLVDISRRGTEHEVGQRYPAEGTTDLGHDAQTCLASGDLPANRGDRRDRGG